MPESENIQLVRRYFDDFWNGRKLDCVDEIFADKVVIHTAHDEPQSHSAEVIKTTFECWCTAFPDLHYEVEHIGESGRNVLVNSVYSGTQSGIFSWAGHGPWEPTHRHMASREMFVFGIGAGKITDIWAIWDVHDVAKQLCISIG